MEIAPDTGIYRASSISVEARNGIYSRSMTVKDGRIVSLTWADDQIMGGMASPDLEFRSEIGCLSTIDFIKLNNPQELPKIRDALAEGKMKNHCLDILA